LQTDRHRFNIYTQVAVLPWRYDAEMVNANSLHACPRLISLFIKVRQTYKTFGI